MQRKFKIMFWFLGLGFLASGFFIDHEILAKDQSWGAITTGARYQLLHNFQDEAVLDRETGLIWERCPHVHTPFDGFWLSAIQHCLEARTGGRGGWRVPSVEELISLSDPSNSFNLPSGDPFCANNSTYWTSTTYPSYQNPLTSAYVVQSANANTGAPRSKSDEYDYWCVRGGTSLQNSQ